MCPDLEKVSYHAQMPPSPSWGEGMGVRAASLPAARTSQWPERSGPLPNPLPKRERGLLGAGRKPFPYRSDSSISRQKGLGLPTAIFVILVLALIAAAIASLEQSGSQAMSYEVLSTRAFYAAESGAQAAVSRLMPPSGTGAACTADFFSHSYSVEGLQGCSVAVSCREDVVDGDSYFTLSSIGRCASGVDETSRGVEVRVR